MVMTESELSALLDAHDALVKACVESTLTFDVFVSAYDGFPNNYALAGDADVNQEQRFILALFNRRIAFHARVARLLSRAVSHEGDANPLYAEVGRFVPAAAMSRIRELVASFPDFKAEPDFRS